MIDKLRELARSFIEQFSLVGASLMLFVMGGYLGATLASFFQLEHPAGFFAAFLGVGGALLVLVFYFAIGHEE